MNNYNERSKAVSNTTDAELDEIFEGIDKAIQTRVMREPLSDEAWVVDMRLKLATAVTEEARAKLKALILRERVDELKRMWNGTQPDIVPEGWHPETEEGKYLQKRIAELSRLSGEEQSDDS